MGKGTNIISDLMNFFEKNDSNRAINCIMKVMEGIKLSGGDPRGTEEGELQVCELADSYPGHAVAVVPGGECGAVEANWQRNIYSELNIYSRLYSPSGTSSW